MVYILTDSQAFGRDSRRDRGGTHGREVLSEARPRAQWEAAGSNPAPPSSGSPVPAAMTAHNQRYLGR